MAKMFQWDKIKNRPFHDNDYITTASRIHSDLSYTETQAGNILTTNWNSFIYDHVNLGDELLFGLTHYYAYNFNLHFFK